MSVFSWNYSWLNFWNRFLCLCCSPDPWPLKEKRSQDELSLKVRSKLAGLDSESFNFRPKFQRSVEVLLNEEGNDQSKLWRCYKKRRRQNSTINYSKWKNKLGESNDLRAQSINFLKMSLVLTIYLILWLNSFLTYKILNFYLRIFFVKTSDILRLIEKYHRCINTTRLIITVLRYYISNPYST